MNRKNTLYTIVMTSLLSFGFTPKNKQAHKDYVPNAQTAVKVAEAIWIPIFGESVLEEKPYVATLLNNVWYVRGSLPPGELGGVASIAIRKSDCKILQVTHGK